LLVIALAVGLLWWAIAPERALMVTVAVLVVSCPCALSLATPAALAAAGAALSRRGVLLTRGHALETLAGVTDVVLDKTGTLTEGRPVLTDLEIAEGFDRMQVLAKVAAVESRSEHPMARAIVESAQEGVIALPTMTDFDSVTGLGVRGTVDGSRVEVGADRFMRELGLDVGGFARTAERLGNEGKSPLYAAIDGRLAAIIAVA
ncbi:HAD-IC family P-type ATPase, partial [Acinetobacter baumannii]